MVMNAGGFQLKNYEGIMNIWVTKNKIDKIVNKLYVGLAYYCDDEEDYVMYGWSIANLAISNLKKHPFIKKYKKDFDYSLYPHYSTFEITWKTNENITVDCLKLFTLDKKYNFNGLDHINYPLDSTIIKASGEITIGNILVDVIKFV